MKVLKITSGVMRFMLAIAGFIMMMCETEDMTKQITLIICGLIVFVAAVLPTVIRQKKELDEFGDL